MLVGGTGGADLLDELSDVGSSVVSSSSAASSLGASISPEWSVFDADKLRTAHRPEPTADPRGDVVQFGGDSADAVALRGEELIELIDIGLEEVTSRQQTPGPHPRRELVRPHRLCVIRPWRSR